jgi:hypothetical protein
MRAICPKKALFLAKKQLSELVYDAVNLEGVNYTLPEVQTLLDGVTVGVPSVLLGMGSCINCRHKPVNPPC